MKLAKTAKRCRGDDPPLRIVFMKKRSSWLMKNTLPLLPGLGSSRSALSPV